MADKHELKATVNVVKGGKKVDTLSEITFFPSKAQLKSGKHVIKLKDLQHCAEGNEKADFASGSIRFVIPIAPHQDNEIRHFLARVQASKGNGGHQGGSGSTTTSAFAFNPTSPPLARSKVSLGGGGRGNSSKSLPKPGRISQPSAYVRTAAAPLKNLPKPPPPPFPSPTTIATISTTTTSKTSNKSKPSSRGGSELDGLLGRPRTPRASAGKTAAEMDQEISDGEDNSLFGPMTMKETQGTISTTTRPSTNIATDFLSRTARTTGRSSSSASAFGALAPSTTTTSPLRLPSSSFSSTLTTRTGLRNLGNTCYMNSILQALSAATNFTTDLLSSFWLTQTLPTIRQPTERHTHLRVYASFTHLLLTLKQNRSAATTSMEKVTDPSVFRRAMASYFACYGSSRQQDAHEFLGDLLNSLQEELCFFGRKYAGRELEGRREREKEQELKGKGKGVLMLTEGGGNEGGGKERGEGEGDGGPSKKKAKRVVSSMAAAAAAVVAKKGGQTLLKFFKAHTHPNKKSEDDATTTTTTTTPSDTHTSTSTTTTTTTTTTAPDTLISEEEAAILEEILPVTRHFHTEVEKTLTCVGADCGYSRSYMEAYTDFSVDLVDPFAVVEEENGKGGGGEGGASMMVIDVDASGESKAESKEQDAQPTRPQKDTTKNINNDTNSDNGGIPLQIFDLLSHAFQTQHLELACERCKKQTHVQVTYKFRQLPHLLVIHLKRFRIDGVVNQKLQTRVMGSASLDLAQFCDGYTSNPRDVTVGLGGPAAPEQTSALLETLRVSSPAPSPSPLTSSSYFPSSSSSDASTSTHTHTHTWPTNGGRHTPKQEMTPAERLEERKRKNLLKNVEENGGRWEDQKETKQNYTHTHTYSSGGASGSGSKKRKSYETEKKDVAAEFIDLVGGDADGNGGGGGGGGEDQDKELQEAIRLSLMESRPGGGGQPQGGEEEKEQQQQQQQQPQPQQQQKHAPLSSRQAPPPPPPPSSSSSTKTHIHTQAEDKENKRPSPDQNIRTTTTTSSTSTAPAPMPLDLRDITRRRSSDGSSSSSSSSATRLRAGDLQSSYELQSVVRHIGKSANCGHYLTDVRTHKPSKKTPSSSSSFSSSVVWTRHDDSLVSHLADGDRILEDDRSLQTGYIYVYRSVPSS